MTRSIRHTDGSPLALAISVFGLWSDYDPMTDRLSPTRRSLLGTVASGGLLVVGGCITLDPSTDADFSDSDVFERVETPDSWGNGRVAVTVRLTPEATTEHGVRRLAVVDGSGVDFDTAALTGGQRAATLFVPTHQKVTMVAVDASGKTVEERQFRVRGTRLP